MEHRQSQIQAEVKANHNFQAYQEADSNAYKNEERFKAKRHR